MVEEKARAAKRAKQKGRVSHVQFGESNVISHSLAAMTSVPWSAASHESLIGPPSELIHINDFLRSSCESAARVFTVPDLPQQFPEGVDPALQDSVVPECRWVSRTTTGPHVEATEV